MNYKITQLAVTQTRLGKVSDSQLYGLDEAGTLWRLEYMGESRMGRPIHKWVKVADSPSYE